MVYPYLGFDRYVDIGALLSEDLVAGIRPTKISANIIRRFGEKFPEENVFLRRYVSDEFDYRSVIDMYEQERSNTPEKPFLCLT